MSEIESCRMALPYDRSALKFVKTADDPKVYCLINGRRRPVGYTEWYEEYDIVPEISLISRVALEQIPLGPQCPPSAPLRGRAVNELLEDPELMRDYLASLLSGGGVECGAGARPLKIPLAAQIRYIEAFDYGSNQSRSYPGTVDYSDFMPVDVIDSIESMHRFPDDSVDFVIASHVIEHSRNPIATLLAFHRICRMGGRVVLIVPNRDFTFDQPRAVTTVEHLLLDFHDPDRTRDLAHYEEWQELVIRGPKIQASLDWEAGVDLHYHCFTPGSFMAMLGATLQYATWRDMTHLVPPINRPEPIAEFYLILQK